MVKSQDNVAATAEERKIEAVKAKVENEIRIIADLESDFSRYNYMTQKCAIAFPLPNSSALGAHIDQADGTRRDPSINGQQYKNTIEALVIRAMDNVGSEPAKESVLAHYGLNANSKNLKNVSNEHDQRSISRILQASYLKAVILYNIFAKRERESMNNTKNNKVRDAWNEYERLSGIFKCIAKSFSILEQR